jgi:hypothetical protein
MAKLQSINWLRTRALSNQQKGSMAVIIVHEVGHLVGYYSLAPTAVVPSILPRSIRTGQPSDPVFLPASRPAWHRHRMGVA